MKLYPLFLHSFSIINSITSQDPTLLALTHNQGGGVWICTAVSWISSISWFSAKYDVKPSSFAESQNGHPACRVSSSAGESGRCHVALGLGRWAAPNHALPLQVSQVYPVVVTPLARKISVNDFTVQLLNDFLESPDDDDAINENPNHSAIPTSERS